MASARAFLEEVGEFGLFCGRVARAAVTPPFELGELARQLDEAGARSVLLVAAAGAAIGVVLSLETRSSLGQGTVGALVNDKQVYNRLAAATTEAHQGAAAFKDDMEALKHNFFLRGFFNNRGYQDEAQLQEHLITRLPSEAPLKAFHFDVKKIFEDVDHAKLKNEQAMGDAGHFLERNPFGLAVVVASSGMKGDSSELQVVLQARALVVREYLVKNFRMDDTRVKTMAVGKGAAASDAGAVDVLVFRGR